ncbi:hypothetical protein MES4922_230126 [Mesorhizobium ventifaucium]|uniref:Uncharacterized protein n=1 Tax=Mesorhizobium ventifaucium TaxID=666020 RepID=A0ABM9DV86_9HYPH|nr:hypothetical protein MES4922_230126 [Mesorhizobium ventifaucium]
MYPEMPATTAPCSSRTNTASAFLPAAPTSLSLNALSRSPRKASSFGDGSAVVSSVVFIAGPDSLTAGYPYTAPRVLVDAVALSFAFIEGQEGRASSAAAWLRDYTDRGECHAAAEAATSMSNAATMADAAKPKLE